MKLIKYNKQKFLPFIPYLGLFLVAICQTLNITRIKDISKAFVFLFKSLFVMYFIIAFLYSLLIHPIIYDEDNLNLTYYLVFIISCLLHMIMGFVLLHMETREIRFNLTDEEFFNYKN